MKVVFTDRDYKILDLVASGEYSTRAPDPYASLNGADPDYDMRMLNMTVKEVLDVWGRRSSSARGRYQFIGSTLQEIVSQIGFDPNQYRFNKPMQDYLGLHLLYRRGYKQWIAGNCTDQGGSHTPRVSAATHPNPNHAAFLINLTKEWAAKPIPIRLNDRVLNGRSYPRPVDSTYYAGPYNGSKGTSSEHINKLIDIYQAGAGEEYEIDLSVDSRPYPANSISLQAQQARRAGGGQDYVNQGRPHESKKNSQYDVKNRTRQSIPSAMDGILPSAPSPYKYEKIHPLDNRYDFRTGKKVRDLLVNGTKPASSFPVNPNNATTGQSTLPPEEVERLVSEKIGNGPDDGSRQSDILTRTRTVNTPSGPQQIEEKFEKIETFNEFGDPTTVYQKINRNDELSLENVRTPFGTTADYQTINRNDGISLENVRTPFDTTTIKQIAENINLNANPSGDKVEEREEERVPAESDDTVPTEKSSSTYEVIPFNASNYTVQRYVSSPQETYVVIRNTDNQRAAEYVEGSAIYNKTNIDIESEIIIIESIDVENKTVTLSNGDVLPNISYEETD